MTQPKKFLIGHEELMDFVRLICEEMTGNTENEYCNYMCGEYCEHAGYIARVEEEKQKAQEILKALE